ncbi:MAG: hypothetical protein EA384_08945 [Spirochaetaceae bacterium]|nr:MAG: hypothetical protein EA384_08945 [Spirochaetaceae bacterium]
MVTRMDDPEFVSIPAQTGYTAVVLPRTGLSPRGFPFVLYRDDDIDALRAEMGLPVDWQWMYEIYPNSAEDTPEAGLRTEFCSLLKR